MSDKIRQRERRAAARAAGKCVQCAQRDARAGRVTCAECAARAVGYVRRKLILGRCRICGKKRDARSAAFCWKHLLASRAHHKKWYASMIVDPAKREPYLQRKRQQAVRAKARIRAALARLAALEAAERERQKTQKETK